LRAIVVSGLGAYAATAFTMWASQRGMSLPLKAGIAACIMTAAGLLAWVDLRRVAGWAAVGFLIGSIVWAPAAVGHLAANVGVFMSKDVAGTENFVAAL
jgi:hypothetical protein